MSDIDPVVFLVDDDRSVRETIPSLLALSDVMGTGWHAVQDVGLAEGETAFPRPSEWEWTVISPRGPG